MVGMNDLISEMDSGAKRSILAIAQTTAIIWENMPEQDKKRYGNNPCQFCGEMVLGVAKDILESINGDEEEDE